MRSSFASPLEVSTSPAREDSLSHPKVKRKWSALLFGFLLALLAVAWHSFTRPPELLSCAPAAALVYIEVADVSRLLDRLRTTHAWQKLSPFVPDVAVWRVPWLGRSQIAFVVTGFDLDGEQLTPHWAVLVRSSDAWGAAALGRELESLARKLLGPVTTEIVDDPPLRITRYRDALDRRTLAWTTVKGVLVVANRDETLRRVSETAAKQRPSLGTDSRFRALRAIVDGNSPIVGFVSGEALRSLGERNATISSPPSAPRRLAREFLGAIVSSLSPVLAFAADVQQGDVVSRYIVGLDPTLSRRFVPLVNGQTDLKSVALIPADVRRVTVYRFGDLAGCARAVEEAVTERLSPLGQIAVREVIGRMKRSLGWDASDTLGDALGNEIAIVEREDEPPLLIIEAREKAKLAMLVGKYLGPLREETYRGYGIFSAAQQPHSAFCFVSEHLLIGHRRDIHAVLDHRSRRSSAADDPPLAAVLRPQAHGAFEVMISFDPSEVVRAVLTLRDLMGSSDEMPPPRRDALHQAVRELPPEVRTSRWRAEGFYSESRSPLGLFATILNLIEVERLPRASARFTPSVRGWRALPASPREPTDGTASGLFCLPKATARLRGDDRCPRSFEF